jgi:hypothetical protein
MQSNASMLPVEKTLQDFTVAEDHELPGVTPHDYQLESGTWLPAMCAIAHNRMTHITAGSGEGNLLLTHVLLTI